MLYIEVSESHKTCGKLSISIKLKDRKTVEHELFQYLIDEFDETKDGKLDKDEVHLMFQILKIDQKLIDKFMKKFEGGDELYVFFFFCFFKIFVLETFFPIK